MAAKHKFQDANIVITSSLSAEKLIEVAQQAVGEFKELNVLGTEADGFGVELRNWAKIQQMTFLVNIVDKGETRTLTTTIHDFMTSQDKVLVFIPVGPKTLVGYKIYKRYMELLDRAVKAVDSSATATLTERVDV